MLLGNYLSLSEAAETLPGNVSRVSVWRWCRHGLSNRGGQIVRLRHIMVGKRMMVCPDDLMRFFELVAQGDEEGAGVLEEGAQAGTRGNAHPEAGDRRKARIEQRKPRRKRRQRQDTAAVEARQHEAERLGLL